MTKNWKNIWHKTVIFAPGPGPNPQNQFFGRHLLNFCLIFIKMVSKCSGEQPASNKNEPFLIWDITLFYPLYSLPLLFSLTTSSTLSFHHQVSGFHWWFFERPQTSEEASRREPFSLDHRFSTESAGLLLAVLVTLAKKVSWNRLATAGSFNFQVQICGLNLRLLTSGMRMVKSQTTRRCCWTHSSVGMTLVLLTALLRHLQ